MRQPLDLRGQRFGRLVALERVASSRSPSGTVSAMWRCLCDCGHVAVVTRRNLRSGNTTSCGCFHREVTSARSRVHNEGTNERRTPEYTCWAHMIARCENRRGPDWPRYGGRGIRVCDRWRTSFEAFLADMGRKPSRAHSIDRIDTDRHYEPGNCRWATAREQRLNQRRMKRPAGDAPAHG